MRSSKIDFDQLYFWTQKNLSNIVALIQLIV